MTDSKKTEQLEWLVDSLTLDRVLKMLSDICAGKAEHIESNWQDKQLAKAWEQAGKRVYEVSINPKVLKVGSGR